MDKIKEELVSLMSFFEIIGMAGIQDVKFIWQKHKEIKQKIYPSTTNNR